MYCCWQLESTALQAPVGLRGPCVKEHHICTYMQAYIDGLPIFTLGVYGWTQSECGILLGILGLTAPIVNQSVGGLSGRLSDRLITARAPTRMLSS